MSTEATSGPDDDGARTAAAAAADEGAVVPQPDPTGDPAVDAATADLARAAGGPLESQVDAFDAAHLALQDRLADVDG